MIWFGYILIFYLFNLILFVCYMLSYDITEWFNVILLHNMTWIIWCLQLYIFFWIFFYSSSFYYDSSPQFFYYKNLLFSIPFNPYFAHTKRWILSLTLSLFIYIYIYIYSFFWWMFNSLNWWIFIFYSTLGWYDLVIFWFFIFLILFSLFVTCYPIKLQNDLM